MEIACRSCGFNWSENMGGTVAEAVEAWREWVAAHPHWTMPPKETP